MIGRTRTKRLMKENDLVTVTYRPFIRTTESDKNSTAFPDLVNNSSLPFLLIYLIVDYD
jgi:hypothetical protein